MPQTIKVRCGSCQAVSPVPTKQWALSVQKGVQLTCPVCNKGKVTKVS